jgi:hypothetical protein
MPNDYKVIGLDATNGRPIVPSSTDTLTIPGNLVVEGTTTTVDAQNVAFEDHFLEVNAKYHTASARDGGITFNVISGGSAVNGNNKININGTSNTITFTGANESSNMPANCLILISGAADAENNGIYQVTSHTSASPSVLTIATSPNANVTGIANTSLATTNTNDSSATISRIEIAVIKTDNTNSKFKVGYIRADATAADLYSTLVQSSDTITADAVAADDISTGDAAVNLVTNSGNVLVDSQAGSVTVDGHTGVTITSTNAGEVDITSAAAVDINATTGVTVDGTTISIDGTDDSNLTVTASAKDLDIAVAGGGTQELRLASAGTGASALHLNASAGSVDIDSADNITLDAADEISITTTSIDGHISLVSAHTAGVAFHIDANANAASEVQIDAGILDIDVTGAATLDADGIALGAGSAELDLTTSGTMDVNSGAFDLDASGAVTIDGAGIALAGGANASSFNVATGGADAKDLTISVTGAGDSSLLLASAGTGTDAMSLDVTAGSMVIAPSLADGKTLKLGKNGAVEMVFTPHGTAANEKFSLTNTAGTAADAVSMTASAGGIQLVCDASAKDIQLAADGVQMIRGFTAGYTVTAGDIVYLNGTDSRLEQCDADSINSSIFLGVIPDLGGSTPGDGDNTNVMVSGIVRNVTSDTTFNAGNHIGKPVYISVTAGKISPSIPSGSGDVIYKVGICVNGSGTAWEVLLQPALVSVLG